MHYLPFLVIAVEITLWSAAAEDFSSPVFPIPPQQGVSWKAPKCEIADPWLSSTAHLAKIGFANPAGCEYREIDVETHSVGSTKGTVITTHGWLIPRGENDNDVHAIAWNGWIYRVARVGDIVSFNDDVGEMVEKGAPNSWSHDARPEKDMVSPTSFFSMKVPLLLLAGEEALAQDLWKMWRTVLSERVNDNQTHAQDPYALLALDWIWAGFDRATNAHHVSTAHGILNTRNFDPAGERDSLYTHDSEERRAVAAHIRRYYYKHRGKTQGERWYDILRDEQGTAVQWLEAAHGLLRLPTDKQRLAVRNFVTIQVGKTNCKMAVRNRGARSLESLRWRPSMLQRGCSFACALLIGKTWGVQNDRRMGVCGS
jgi:hypothetical protein